MVTYQLVHVNSVITNLPLSDRKDIRNASRNKIQKTILEGFPEKKSEVSPSILEYWNIRNELSYTDGLILKGSKLFVPRSLRTELLQKTNTWHIGREKCTQSGRQVMYWPGMIQSFEEKVKSCSECLKIRPKETAELLFQYETPNYPWEKNRSWLVRIQQQNYLVMCDYY